jgi:SAM-dependent methyltransferase
MNVADPALRQKVHHAYSEIALTPAADHPFPVGRRLAERTGYPASWLARVPAPSLDAFAGISCLPCFAEIEQGARVLDLGCGAGLDSLLVAGGAGAVLGLDFSQPMLARARAAACAVGAANVGFVRGDAEAIPAAAGSIDVAMVNGIFNLNPARAGIFRELARVVRPGGTVYAAELVVVEPAPEHAGRHDEADWFA